MTKKRGQVARSDDLLDANGADSMCHWAMQMAPAFVGVVSMTGPLR